MKSKMKKFTSIAAMSAILASTSLSSVFAAGGGMATTQSKSTAVEIGILESEKKPDQINVTVPTVLALTVHADTDTSAQQEEVKTYVGGSDGNGANATGNNSLTFKNQSTRADKNGKLEGIPLEISGFGITSNSTTSWTISKQNVSKETPFKLNLTVNGTKVEDLKHGQTKDIYFKDESEKQKTPFVIKAPEIIGNKASVRTANMDVYAKAGGKNQDYRGQGTNKGNTVVAPPAAFTIEWKITSKSNSEGVAE